MKASDDLAAAASSATNRLAVASTMPPMTQYGAVAANPQRMPWSSAIADTGRIRNSTQTPASRNNAAHANDSERTRAGETWAKVATNGGVKMPPTNDVTAPTTMTAGRFGKAQRIAMPMPTPTSDRRAHFIGSPRSRGDQRGVNRAESSTPANDAAPLRATTKPRPRSSTWKTRSR